MLLASLSSVFEQSLFFSFEPGNGFEVVFRNARFTRSGECAQRNRAARTLRDLHSNWSATR